MIPFQNLIQMIPGIACKQRPNYLEAFSGIDLENKYDIYEKRIDTNKTVTKIPILMAKEKSDYCTRQCCSNACRAMDIIVYNLTGNIETKSLLITKETQCSLLCLNRPEFLVYFTENGQSEYLGRIIDNFDCYNQTFTIKNSKDTLLYKIIGNCCQAGFWFSDIPANRCQKVTFDLRDAHGRLVQKIKKKGAGVFNNWLTDADNYYIDFNVNMNWR